MTPSLFRTLGAQPILGHFPTRNADKSGGPPEAMISKKLWESAYGGKATVLGKILHINPKPYRIVGVMPSDFFFETSHINAWLTLVMTPKRTRSANPNYWMVVRRKPGISLKRLRLELRNQRRRMLAKTPPDLRQRAIAAGYKLDAKPLRATELNLFGIGDLPWLLQATAGFLLLLALANSTNLGLVRQYARQHEFRLRRALGANRTRLVCWIFIEHLPITVITGISAVLLYWASINALHAAGLPPTFSPFQISLTPVVIIFIWITTVLSVLVVVSAPALLTGGKRLSDILRHGPTETGGKAPHRIQRGLGVVEVGLASTLLIAGSLLGVSVWQILSQPIGFSPQHWIEATIISPQSVKKSSAWTALRTRLKQLPGVVSVAASDMIPFSQVGSVHDVVRKPGVSSQSDYIRRPHLYLRRRKGRLAGGYHQCSACQTLLRESDQCHRTKP